MKTNKNNKEQHPQNRSSSNPENSFEAGKQGGQKSQQITDQSGGKDISNSLKKDAVGNRGANDYTPMNQTDNELGTEKRRNNQ